MMVNIAIIADNASTMMAVSVHKRVLTLLNVCVHTPMSTSAARFTYHNMLAY